MSREIHIAALKAVFLLPGEPPPLATRLHNAAHPLGSADDLDPLLDAIGDARFVLLGEATHGTSEFYTWRTEISRRLIREKGFSFIGGM